jgi:hypothetical protein
MNVANRLMRVIPRLGYRLTEFAYLAAASKATRAANLAFPCKPDGYILGSYRIATTPEANSNRLTSFKSARFDSPANNVGPWPANFGCTKNSYSSINPSSANASGSFTPPMSSGLLKRMRCKIDLREQGQIDRSDGISQRPLVASVLVCYGLEVDPHAMRADDLRSMLKSGIELVRSCRLSKIESLCAHSISNGELLILRRNIAGEERARKGGAQDGPGTYDNCFGVHVNLLVNRRKFGSTNGRCALRACRVLRGR